MDWSKSLVLLDRDGVINQDLGDYVCRPEDLHIFPQALAALARLSAQGVRVGLCTNQAGIARGRYDEAMLARIHQKLFRAVEKAGGRIDRLLFCPSYTAEDPWRKPNPGMLWDQARFFGLENLQGVPFVGDSWTDVEAARRAGAVPVLLRTGKGEAAFKEYAEDLAGVAIYADLAAAVRDWFGE